MKKIDVAMWELTKEEVCKKSANEEILIYNPMTKNHRVECCDKKCIARSKRAAKYLVYLSFEENNDGRYDMKIYENIDRACDCHKCELSKECVYKEKYNRLGREFSGALGKCAKLKENGGKLQY